jgi:hypothetical protein
MLVVALVALNAPKVETLVKNSMPALLPSEQKRFPIARLQLIRASAVLQQQAQWQRSALRRLDQAEKLARRMGLGRDALHAAFGHPWVPGTVSHLSPPLYDLYDAVGLLDLPGRGRPGDPAAIRAALGAYFIQEKEPRPGWIAPQEPWPPEGDPLTRRPAD